MIKNNGDTKSDRVYEALREAIIIGQLYPKQKLIISELASEYGVSEIPVREALTRLQEHRLIELIPYKGFFVHHFTMKELKDSWMIRQALEELAVHLLVENFDGNIPQEITQIMNKMEDASKNGSIQTYRKLNKQFHLATYKICQNDRLIELIDKIWEETERASQVFGFQRARPADSMQEHRFMIQALLKCDEEEMIRLLRHHRATNLAIIRDIREKAEL